MNYRLLRIQYLFYCSAKNTILVFFRVSDQNLKLQNWVFWTEFLEPPTVVCPPTPTPPSRWKIRAPCRNRVHPQRGRPRVRERDRRRRGGAAKATDRPDQTPWRPPQSLQLEGPALPPFSDAAPSTALWNPRHTRPLYLSLSRLCTHGERRRPSFQFNYSKNKPTSIAQRWCLWGAWRWNEEAWRGWMRLTRTLITFCGQRGERWVCSTVTPPPYL